jgi:hypothetical protein
MFSVRRWRTTHLVRTQATPDVFFLPLNSLIDGQDSVCRRGLRVAKCRWGNIARLERAQINYPFPGGFGSAETLAVGR